MDIAKIRKKAKEQEAVKQPPAETAAQEPSAIVAPPVPEAAPVAEPMPEPETLQQVVPEPTVKPEEPAAEPKDEAAGEQMELLTFRVGTEECAFRVDEVEEIIRMQKITQVPTMPDYMEGITSLRGKIIPVISLAARLKLTQPAVRADEGTDSAAGGKILIISGPKGFIGAIIDRVLGVVRLAEDEVLEPPAHLTEIERKYIEGIVVLDKRFISVIRAGDTMDIEIR